MTDTIKELLASKRFLVTVVLGVIPLTIFVVVGKMPASEYIVGLKQLGGLLTILYGAENVAQALKGPTP